MVSGKSDEFSEIVNWVAPLNLIFSVSKTYAANRTCTTPCPLWSTSSGRSYAAGVISTEPEYGRTVERVCLHGRGCKCGCGGHGVGVYRVKAVGPKRLEPLRWHGRE